jgi:hypothetical protein
MPTLRDILVDPAYTNANLATKQALFEMYAAKDSDFTSANPQTQDAIRRRFGASDMPSDKPGEVLPEIKTDPIPKWKYRTADAVAGTSEGAGIVYGGIKGAALGAPAGPLGSLTGAVLGAGAGGGSGRGIGEGFNRAVLGIGSPEGYGIGPAIARGAASEVGGRALAAGGLGLMRKFPSADKYAGKLFSETSDVLPPTTPQGVREPVSLAAVKSELEGAQGRLGVSRLPESVNPNLRRASMARTRASVSPKVAASEKQLEAMAREQAASSLESSIPGSTVEKAAAVRKELQAFDARVSQEAAAANLARKETVEGAAAAQAEQKSLEALRDVQDSIPKRAADPQEMGRDLLARLRGEKTVGEIPASGREKVSEVFNNYYKKYDVPEAVAPSDTFAKALKASRQEAVDAGAILKNFADKAGVAEARLFGEGGELVPEFTLAQWRGIKGEFAQAAQDAAKAQNFTAARTLGSLKELARAGEDAAAAKLGKKAFSGYAQLREAYKNVFVEGYRRGYVGELLRPGGRELGGEAVAAGDVFTKLKNVDHADSLMTALGAEKLASKGSVLRKTPAMLREIGKEDAKKTVLPYFEQEIAFEFQRYGGGVDGTKAVVRYLRDNRRVLEKYGIDFEKLRASIGKFSVTEARVSGVQKAAYEKTVAETLGSGGKSVTEPYNKVPNLVFKSDDPVAAYTRLQGVSKDPTWKESVDGLLKDNLKKRIDAGVDIYNDPITAEVLPLIFSKPQLQSLRDYQTIIKQLAAKNPGTKGVDPLRGGPAEAVELGINPFPVGMRYLYMVKNVLRLGAKAEAASYRDATMRYLDNALIDPAEAKKIVDAFKGSAFGRESLLEAIKAEQAAMTKFGKLNRAGIDVLGQLVSPAEDRVSLEEENAASEGPTPGSPKNAVSTR